MSLLFLSLFLSLLLSLPPSPSLCCQSSSFTECQSAPFVPGHDLVGEGFDAVLLKTTGSAVVDVKSFMIGGEKGNCTMCHNRLLNQTQKVPASVLDWKIRVACRRSLSSRVFSSSQSILKEHSKSMGANWKVGLGLPGVGGVAFGGTHSKSSTFAQSRSKSDKFSFIKHDLSCQYYTFRVHARPPLAKEFQESLQNLPSTFHHKNTSAFRHFISLYGTHYIRRVMLGGRVNSLTAVRTCEAYMSGLSTRTVQNCLTMEANAVIKGVKASAAAGYCKNKSRKLQRGQSFSSTFSDRSVEVLGGDPSVGQLLFNPKGHQAFTKWLQTLKHLPGVVQYQLRPLHLLVKDNPPLQSSLRSAIREYLMSNSVSLSCSSHCRIGVRRSNSCSCTCHGHSLVNGDCCPTARGLARLNVIAVKGEGLYGDWFSKTDGYVKIFYGQESGTSGVIWNNDFPVWNFLVRFGSVDLTSRKSVRIEVWDRDSVWNDDLLGKASMIPTSGKIEKRFKLKHGSVTIQTQAVCGPSLQGELCEQYQPSPMDWTQTGPRLDQDSTQTGEGINQG